MAAKLVCMNRPPLPRSTMSRRRTCTIARKKRVAFRVTINLSWTEFYRARPLHAAGLAKHANVRI